LKLLKKRKWFKIKLFLIFVLTGLSLCGAFIYGILEGRKTAIHYYTDLPNSCFIESMIHASRANLLLSLETKLYSSVYAFTYHYKDDYAQNKNKAKIFGHAVCVFEYKGILWIYDSVWGTMPVDKISNHSQYKKILNTYIEKNYEYKILESFLVEDWKLPSR